MGNAHSRKVLLSRGLNMAHDDGPIASAVVVPEAEAPTAPLKRRQSSASDSTSKRPRLSVDASSRSPPNLRDSPQPIESPKSRPEGKLEDGAQNKRKSSVQEEKKRGQRLFGGLLSTLSQSTPNGQQKRRLEIETRHSNLLAMAHFLCTKSEPKIYYKPWELLPRDEERIKSQIREAEATIERETSQFDLRHPNRPGRTEKEERSNSTSKETVGEPQAESPSVSKVADTTNSPVQIPQSEQNETEKQAQEEHNGEVVVENDEDTVIY